MVCGRDEDKIADLKCTRIGSFLVWVPVDNPRKCGVAKRDAEAEAEADLETAGPKECKSGKPFTGQAGCSQCKVKNNVVCGRDEDKIADLRCTRIGHSLVWVPVNNPHKCGVAKREAEAEAEAAGPKECKSGKPFTGQAGCSQCKVKNNVVCGRDEDKIADLRCTRIGHSLVWVPVNNPHKCGVAKRDVEAEAVGPKECKSGKPFTGQAGCSQCKVKNNVVCGRDEDKIADLRCTRIGHSLVWVPVNNPRKCGV